MESLMRVSFVYTVHKKENNAGKYFFPVFTLKFLAIIQSCFSVLKFLTVFQS